MPNLCAPSGAISIDPIQLQNLIPELWPTPPGRGRILWAHDWYRAAAQYHTLYRLLQDAAHEAAAMCLWLSDTAQYIGRSARHA